MPTYLKNISKPYENERPIFLQSSIIGVMVWELDTSVVDCWFEPLVGSNQRLFKYNPSVNQTILKLKIKDSWSVLWLFDSDGCLWISKYLERILLNLDWHWPLNAPCLYVYNHILSRCDWATERKCSVVVWFVRQKWTIYWPLFYTHVRSRRQFTYWTV